MTAILSQAPAPVSAGKGNAALRRCPSDAFASLTSLSSVPHRSASLRRHALPCVAGVTGNERSCMPTGRKGQRGRFAHESFERAAPLRRRARPGSAGVSQSGRPKMPTGRKGQRVRFAHESYRRAAPLRWHARQVAPESPGTSDRGCRQGGRDNEFASLTSLSSVPHRSAALRWHARPGCAGVSGSEGPGMRTGRKARPTRFGQDSAKLEKVKIEERCAMLTLCIQRV